MSPDNNHVGIPLQQSVPDLQMLDLLEVLLWFVVLVEESSEVRSQELLPPAIVLGSQLQFIIRHKTSCSTKVQRKYFVKLGKVLVADLGSKERSGFRQSFAIFQSFFSLSLILPSS